MSDIVKALEGLLAVTPTESKSEWLDNTHDPHCQRCAALRNARAEAQAALDAMPTLKWSKACSDGYSAKVGAWELTAYATGAWLLYREGTREDEGYRCGTLDAAKLGATDALRTRGVLFRAVAP